MYETNCNNDSTATNFFKGIDFLRLLLLRNVKYLEVCAFIPAVANRNQVSCVCNLFHVGCVDVVFFTDGYEM